MILPVLPIAGLAGLAIYLARFRTGLRVCVLTAIAQYAFSQASEGVRVNAFRAASMYTGMAARMTQMLQENAAVMVPNFVVAM